MDERLITAASRYVARCRLAGDQRPIEKLLREVCDFTLATRLAAELLRRSWQA